MAAEGHFKESEEETNSGTSGDEDSDVKQKNSRDFL